MQRWPGRTVDLMSPEAQREGENGRCGVGRLSVFKVLYGDMVRAFPHAVERCSSGRVTVRNETSSGESEEVFGGILCCWNSVHVVCLSGTLMNRASRL